MALYSIWNVLYNSISECLSFVNSCICPNLLFDLSRSHDRRNEGVYVTIALFTHGQCGAVYINLARSTFYCVFTLLSVWTGLHRHDSALAVRPVHI